MQQTTTRWLTPDETQPMMSSNAWALISDANSLTQKLRDLTNNDLAFRFLNAGWGNAYPNEIEKLAIAPNEQTWIRNIEMGCQKKLWIIGRVVIPKKSVTEKLKNVGANSIGDVLFKDPNLKRSEFEFLLLNGEHPYLQHIPSTCHSDKPIWARRSIFHFENKPLLVVEIFMPEIFYYAH